MKSGIVTFAALLCLTASAAAQDAIADFYRGKTVRITVGSAVGGGFDGYARLVGSSGPSRPWSTRDRSSIRP